MRILVTGANGYIGTEFIKEYGHLHDFVRVSLREKNIPEIDFSYVETVLHLSALVHQTKSLPKEDYFKINTEQTIALATAAKTSGVKHFVFFSTAAVYGETGYFEESSAHSIDEKSGCNPTNPYGESKLLAEKKLAQLEDEFFTVSIIRPPIVYGKNSPGNMNRLRKLVQLCPVLPFNYKNNKRSMVGIKNLLYFTGLVIEKKVNGILIPQDPEAHSISYIVTTLAKGSGKKVILVKFPSVVFHYLCRKKKKMMSTLYGSLVFDSTISNERLEFTAPYSTEDGLLLMGSPGVRQAAPRLVKGTHE